MGLCRGSGVVYGLVVEPSGCNLVISSAMSGDGRNQGTSISMGGYGSDRPVLSGRPDCCGCVGPQSVKMTMKEMANCMVRERIGSLDVTPCAVEMRI